MSAVILHLWYGPEETFESYARILSMTPQSVEKFRGSCRSSLGKRAADAKLHEMVLGDPQMHSAGMQTWHGYRVRGSRPLNGVLEKLQSTQSCLFEKSKSSTDVPTGASLPRVSKHGTTGRRSRGLPSIYAHKLCITGVRYLDLCRLQGYCTGGKAAAVELD